MPVDTRSPFRAAHVGSFLRPPSVTDRARHDNGTIEDGDLREIEDAAITEVVHRQEGVGLRGITDGEFQRFMFHIDFLEQLDGVTVTPGEFLARFKRDDGTEVEFQPPTIRVESPIRHTRSIQGEDYDLTAAYRQEIADLAERGCTYLQMDDTNLAYLCDPEVRQRTAARGDHPDDLTRLYCKLVNDSIKDRPTDMTAAVHLCRGNFQSAWVSQGGYATPWGTKVSGRVRVCPLRAKRVGEGACRRSASGAGR